MKTTWLYALPLAATLCLPLLAGAQETDLPEPPTTVVIQGRHPGPGMWKVSKGEHVMWVFGLYSPLPKKMEWDDARAERLIQQSQEVLLQPAAEFNPGFFGTLSLLPLIPDMVGFARNPDGRVLRDVLPADVYARWSALKARFIGKDDVVERLRPILAGDRLLKAGLEQSGLAQGDEVQDRIARLAKSHGVKLSKTGYEVPMEVIRKMTKGLGHAQIDDLACFTRTLDSLESDIESARVRANAWANGDTAEISKLDYTARENACSDAVENAALAKDDPVVKADDGRLRATWLQAAERALADNRTTFAILAMKDMLGADGYLAALQAKGYTVESPKN